LSSRPERSFQKFAPEIFSPVAASMAAAISTFFLGFPAL